MKDAAEKSFAKKGQAIVEMNWKAIDAGFDAYHKVEVPASWADAQDAPVATTTWPATPPPWTWSRR